MKLTNVEKYTMSTTTHGPENIKNGKEGKERGGKRMITGESKERERLRLRVEE